MEWVQTSQRMLLNNVPSTQGDLGLGSIQKLMLTAELALAFTSL